MNARMEDVDVTRINETPKPEIVDQSKLMDDQELIKMTMKVKGGSATDAIAEIEGASSNYHAITGLPSGGRLYPPNTTVMGRPFKVAEIKKLSTLNENNGDFVINDTLKRTIKGIDINDLYIADKIYVLLWLRANTYRSSDYIVNFSCGKCNKQSQYHFDVDKIEIQYLSDEYQPNKMIHLPSNDVITYKYMTIGDEMAVERFREMNSKIIGDTDSELIGLAQMVTSINGQQKGLMEKFNWVLSLDPESYSYLTTFIEKFGMGVRPYVTVQCDKCGGMVPVGISFQADFFIPEYKVG